VIDQPVSSTVATPLSPISYEQNVIVAAKGGSITFVGKLFVYGARFVIALVLARLLAAGQYGLYNLSLTAVELFTYLAQLGMATALVRYVSHFASQRDEAGLWGTLQIGFGLGAILSMFFALALFVLADTIAVRLFNEPRLAPLLQMVSLVVPAFTLSDLAAAATRGFKTMKYTVIAQNFTQPLVRLTLILILAVFVGLNARWALVASIITELIVAGLLLRFLNKLFPLRRPLQAGRREFRRLLRFALPVYGANLINRFGGNIRMLLLGIFGAVSSVGVYALASQINLLGDMFQSSLGNVAQPIISELYSRGDRRGLGRFYQLMTKWSLMLNLPLFLILVLFPGSLLALFGDSFVAGSVALGILAWTGMVDVITGLCGVMLDMTDNTHLKLINTSITLVLSVGLSLGLIPTLGVYGAALSALAAQIIVNVLRMAEVFFLFRVLPYSRGLLKPLAIAGVSVAVVLFVAQWLPPAAGASYFGINVAILLAVYIGLTLLVGLSPEDRAVAARLRRRLSARRER